jgi:hypothetical protein
MVMSQSDQIDSLRTGRIAAVRENVERMDRLVNELLKQGRYDDAKAIGYGQALAEGMLDLLETSR